MKIRNLHFILFFVAAIVPFVSHAQKFATKTGNIKFEASVPSFEEVAAENKNVSAILNAGNGEFAALALMNGFRFKVALMEEHFNESYAETAKYPKAVFKGKLDGFSLKALSEKPKQFTLTGELSLHGKTKKINDVAMVSIKGNIITVTGNFMVKPADFDIDVPKVVSKKIADEVQVIYTFVLEE